jgi:hypothetical protein
MERRLDMVKKIFWICATLVLAFAAAGVSASFSRAAVDCNNPSALKFGRMGVVANGEDFPCRVRVRAIKPELAPAMKGGIPPRSVLSIRSRLDRNDRSVFDNPAYVYFDLSASEASAWKNDKLQVMVYNSIRDQWETVESMQLSGGSAGRMRIGNRLSRFGLYGLSKTK